MARILFVDDDADLRLSVECVLKAQGHIVTAVGDGLQAIDLIQGLGEFDILIADLRMAPIDGMEVIETARRERPDLSVIVMSAYITEDIFQRAIEIGVSGFIDKPFSLEDLLVPVREVLLKRGKSV